MRAAAMPEDLGGSVNDNSIQITRHGQCRSLYLIGRKH